MESFSERKSDNEAESYVPRREQLLPSDMQVLEYMSLGYNVKESEQHLNLAYETIRTKRSRLKKLYRARTNRQTIVTAIQGGDLPIKVEAVRSPDPLSFEQDTVLRLVALGWKPDEIAKRLGVSRHTVNAIYSVICTKLEAKNMYSSMRRAFELSVLHIDEPILDPSEEFDRRTRGLRISVDDKVLRPDELGMTNPRQVELLRALGPAAKNGRFRSRDIYKQNFYPNAESQNARAHAFAHAIGSLIAGLELAVGEPVVERVGSHGGRAYEFTKPVILETLDANYFIPAITEEQRQRFEIARKAKSRAKMSRRRKRLPRKQVVKVTIEPQKMQVKAAEKSLSDDFIDPDQLPELSVNLLQNLEPRDPQEVLENTPIKRALLAVNALREPLSYRQKLLVALRYGVDPNRRGAPFLIERKGQKIDTRDIWQYIPNFQGLSVESTSLISGLKPEAILRSEIDFLSNFMTAPAELLKLAERLRNQI